jgi:RNA 2',3'-cyclic 3'-phosphodiesterase
MFLALDLPEGVRAALGGSPKLHVTLVFIGERESAEGVWRAASAAADGLETPLFAPLGVVGVPRRRPRLFALDLEDVGGRGAVLHEAVSAALGEAVTRPFWPHVTLVRARKGRRAEAPAAPGGPEPFAPSDLTLYRSHTGPEGSRYEVLERRGL